jgi:hypothetical protein
MTFSTVNIHFVTRQQEISASGVPTPEFREGGGSLRVLLRCYRLKPSTDGSSSSSTSSSGPVKLDALGLKPEEQGHVWPLETSVCCNQRFPPLKQRKVRSSITYYCHYSFYKWLFCY